jgi:hypothetical protein
MESDTSAYPIHTNRKTPLQAGGMRRGQGEREMTEERPAVYATICCLSLLLHLSN